MKKFLTAEEEEEIIEAIRATERKTSGEIRVHIEKKCPDEIFNRAMDVFHQLNMDKTKQQNGVLIYVAVEDRNFIIYGDNGINKVVPNDFWESTKDVIVEHFKKGKYKEGLIAGIHKAGEQLKKHFPYQKDDKNELSDEISKG